VRILLAEVIKVNAQTKRKLDEEVEKHATRMKAVVEFWNKEFFDVAVSFHIRRYIREAVARADKFGRPGSTAKKEDDVYSQRDKVAKELEQLEAKRDSLLSDLNKDAKNKAKAQMLVKAIELIISKDDEVRELEDRIDKEVKASSSRDKQNKDYKKLTLIQRLELPLTAAEARGDENVD
jgi:hypothetical protein